MSINKFLEKVPNLAQNILTIGVGQAGANLAYEFQNLGYTSVYINTSKKDLLSLPDDVDDDVKIHIAGATGCNKNREKAKKYAQKHFQRIVKDILERFGSFTHYLFTFSMGGGTGSGIAPMLIRAFKAIAPEKTIMTLAAVASASENRARANSVMCYNDLMELEGLGNQYWIDNDQFESAEEMIKHNKVIVSTVHQIFNMSSTDARGNLDDNEVLDLLSAEGTVAFGRLKKFPNKRGNRLILDGNFLSSRGQCSYIAYSITDSELFISEELEGIYGVPDDHMKAYKEEGDSFITLFGLPAPVDKFDELQEVYTDYQLEREEAGRSHVNKKIDINVVDSFVERRKLNEEEAYTLENLFDGLM